MLIGLAGLIDWRPRIATAAACLSVAWSVLLALSLVTVRVFDYRTTDASTVVKPLATGEVSPGEFVYGLRHYSVLLNAVGLGRR